MADKDTQLLEQKIQKLTAENAELKSREQQREVVESRVVEKMKAGLTREHAQQAVFFQDESDRLAVEEAAKLEKAALDKEPAKAKA